MARSSLHRLTALLAAGAAGSALAAAPALATEDPTAPPPPPPPAWTLPTGVAPVTFPAFPSASAPAVRRTPRLIRRARLVHRRVRRGQRGLLRVSLTQPSRLRVVLSRRAGGHPLRSISLPARGRRVALRLPARVGGRALRAGRYRVSVVAIDATGVRSRPVRLTMIVRRGARR